MSLLAETESRLRQELKENASNKKTSSLFDTKHTQSESLKFSQLFEDEVRDFKKNVDELDDRFFKKVLFKIVR